MKHLEIPPFFTYLMDIILHQLIEAVGVKISWNISWIALIQSSQLMSITENFKPIALPRRWRSDWVSWSLVAPHLYRALLASDPLRRCNNDSPGVRPGPPTRRARSHWQTSGRWYRPGCPSALQNSPRKKDKIFGIFKGPQRKALVFFFRSCGVDSHLESLTFGDVWGTGHLTRHGCEEIRLCLPCCFLKFPRSSRSALCQHNAINFLARAQKQQ